MPPTTMTNGLPAGYGMSCTNCARAKCRCILRPAGSGCERCHRLGKECQRIAATRKRSSKRSASSRTAQLEEKLEGLVSILRASQKSDQHALHAGQSLLAEAASVEAPPQPSAPASASQPLLSRLDSLAAAATANEPGPQPRRSSCRQASACASDAAPNTDFVRPEPKPQEAEVYLAKFRTWLGNFPYMHLAPDLTAEALQRERPFLWMSIMNMTSMSLPQQYALRDKVRQELAARVVLNNERSMDLLLGLLGYISWATMNTGPGTMPFLVLYCQMATTILYDMGLTRSPDEEHQSGLYLKVWSLRPAPAPKVRTMEERRAVLSLWFCTSICASFIGKMETLIWTPHMDDCLDVLEREGHGPLDEVLAAIIRVQLINEDVQKLLRVQGSGENRQGPTHLYKAGLITRLDELRRHLPAHLQSHPVIKSQLLAAEAGAHSVGLFTDQDIPDAKRISSMYSCAKAAAAWFDCFFSVPLADVPGLPFTIYVSMSHLQAILYKLTTSEDPVWDKQVVRSNADLLALLDRTMGVFRKVGETYYLRTDDNDGNIFAKGARIMANVKNLWEPALSQHLSNISGGGSSGNGNDLLLTPNSHGHGDQVMGGLPNLEPKMMLVSNPVLPDAVYDINDMAWMADIFGPWDL